MSNQGTPGPASEPYPGIQMTIRFAAGEMGKFKRELLRLQQHMALGRGPVKFLGEKYLVLEADPDYVNLVIKVGLIRKPARQKGLFSWLFE